MTYPEPLIAPMRAELTRLGVQELRDPEAVDKAEDEGHDSPLNQHLAGEVLNRHIRDAQGDQALDQTGRDGYHVERRQHERDAVRDREESDDLDERQKGRRQQQESHQKRQVVVAGENVLDPECDELEDRDVEGNPRCVVDRELGIVRRQNRKAGVVLMSDLQ